MVDLPVSNDVETVVPIFLTFFAPEHIFRNYTIVLAHFVPNICVLRIIENDFVCL